MFGKIVNGRLVVAGRIVTESTKTITNPKREQLITLGYKEIVYCDKPKFDNEEEKLEELYMKNEKEIVVSYTVVKLTDEEHNEIINNEIRQKESLISVELIATALVNNIKGTKDNSAITEIENILSEIDSLKKELRGNK